MHLIRNLIAMPAGLALLVAAIAAEPLTNIAGKWIVTVSGANVRQQIELKQAGSAISGTFKGPRQSGALKGNVDGDRIAFHVMTPIPIDYMGTADGDTMKGTLSARGKSSQWTATRVKER